MSKFSIIRRQQMLREAEGYLDLIMVLAHRWPPTAEARDRLAQRALDLLTTLEKFRWHRSDVLYLKGIALKCMERYTEATVPLQKAARIDPENCRILLALGWCQKRCGRLDLAIRSLERGLSVDNEQAILHYNLACYWSLADRSSQAIKYLAEAFELEPDYRNYVADERDFDPIRGDPEFQALMAVIV